MSSKKIIRLKTPTKIKQYGRTPESTFANTNFIELQTVTEVHNSNEYSQTLHQNLIKEINKLYRDIEAIKKEVEQQQRINIELYEQKKRLKSHIQLLQRECQNYQEMYQLQRHNHLRLRNFYEERERQWQYIVFEHKRMLEQFDRKHQTSLSKIEQIGQNLQETREEEGRKQELPQKIKKIKRISGQDKKVLLQNKPIQPQQAYYFTEINRLYSEEQKFAKKSKINQIEQSEVAKGFVLRNPQIDDLFDRIMRKTHYYFRQKCFSINQIKQCEDMIKLKHAKTSTKQRLLKTIKKLQFQTETQNQLNVFCQYIEDLVLKQQKMLRGDLVYNFIIDKLKECQRLAQASNSQIQKIELNSVVQGRQFPQKSKIDEKCDIQRLSRQNLELLLNSTIKKPPKLGSEVSQNIRYSISSLQNLSELIHGDTVGLNIETKLIEQTTN